MSVSESAVSESQEVQKPEVQRSKNWKSGITNAEFPEVQNMDTNYNNINYNDLSYNNPINQSVPELQAAKDDTNDMMEGINTYMQLIRENIEYDYYMSYEEGKAREMVEELYQIICDVVCVKRSIIRIGKEDYPYELVKSKFLKLNKSHIEYVMWCMKNTTTKIGNIRSYMITTLYNAPMRRHNIEH